MSILISILCHTFFLFLLTNANSDQVHDQEQVILLRLKQHWQNPTSLDHWTSSNTSHCTWPEVTCNDSSVAGLILREKNITGSIPPFITDLKNLTVLDFYNNSIIGNFPVALYNLSKLEFLDLSQNYFVGAIPDDIDRLVKISNLSLCCNNFTGNIPPAVGRLPELRALLLNQNLFNGTFPSEIGNLSNLEMLRLAYNGFLPSRLPSSFTRLKKLKELWIYDANLIGEIPETIGEMLALEWLDLSSNALTGNIPSNLFMLKNLTFVYLFKNMLSGEIPQVIKALNLTIVDLSQNNLTGRIPDDFGKLQKLSGLALFFNQLSGEIPESIGRLPALEDLRLFSNNLSGGLPPDLGRYSMLSGFQVASNRLTGKLPENLCNGGKLVGVVAFDNNLSGELPESLWNCSSLEIFRISNNAFSGNIPVGLWTGLSLKLLMIGDNLFTGELPNEISRNLSLLEISNNRFSGKIPIQAGSWMNLVVFNASNNLFSGTIPQELTALPQLTTLLLDKNKLTGALPSDIISWRSLNTLNVSQNQLFGQIPEKIGVLQVLTELDLSENQFSGQIPHQLGFLKLTYLNLSSNFLTGEIPSEFENAAYASSFLNNSGLCSVSSSALNLNACNSIPQNSSKTSTNVLALTLSVVIACFLLALLLLFIICRVYWKRKHRLDSRWKFTSFQRLDFTESKILSGLTESNIIGKGGSGKVYRVALNGSSKVVAVKRICSNRKLDQKLEKEFISEVQILSTLRHSNIVKLLCCVSNDNSKLLVYEYLENCSLYQWLHSQRRSKTTNVSGSVRCLILDWPKRFQIAVGAAQGLYYMHHECLPPIVHRDVKSSNILLDSDFNAKIADFGLAQMLVKQGELATVSSVAGSFGYIAPEYAHTVRVNEKTDVYSFGVVLLELTTGKEAHSGDENTCLAEWARRHMQEGKPIADALAVEIREPCYLEEMSKVFKAGIMCTSTLPSSRPSMKDVLNFLCPLDYGVKNFRSEYDVTPLLWNSKHERMSESDDTILTSNVSSPC